MIFHNCKQGSDEWHRLRCGIPTASEFHRILTPKTLEPAAGAFGYLCECFDEVAFGGPLDEATAQWMERGHKFEERARAWYAWDRDVEVRETGFVTNDKGTAGASNDGLVLDDGVLECKVLAAKNHTAFLLSPYEELLATAFDPLRKPPKDPKKPRKPKPPPSLAVEHRMQIQGNLWICERQWCDIISYNPDRYGTGEGLPPVVERVTRDEPLIEKLAAAVAAFNEQLDQALREHGYREPN